MTPEYLATLGIKALSELVVALLRDGRAQHALDAAEELAQRVAFEEAQRKKASLWYRLFGGRK